jgi:hypothetical protein
MEESYFRRVAKYVEENFVRCCTDEYGSRVVQIMLDINLNFCDAAIALSFAYFDHLVSSFSASIMLTKLVGLEFSNKTHNTFIKILEQNKEYLRKAYFNRMLSTLVSCCSDQILDRVLDAIKPHAWELMNDKFGNCVLQGFFKRNHIPGINSIINECRANAEHILMRRYPKLMLINLIHENIFGDAIQGILESLTALKVQLLQAIVQRRESFCLLLLMIASSTEEAASNILNRLTEIPDINQAAVFCESVKQVDQDLQDYLRSLCSNCRIGKIKQ